MLLSGPTPNFWLPPTDNDLGNGMPEWAAPWQAAGPGKRLLSLTHFPGEGNSAVVQAEFELPIQQENPFFGDSKIRLFLDIENFLNLLDDSHGTKRYINVPSIPSAVGVVSAQIDPADSSRYLYSSFTPPVEVSDTFDSLYKIQFGIRGEF